MGLIPVALMMQLQGIEVNREKQAELVTSWTEEMNKMKVQLDEIIGREINFNSPKQMQELLYGDLNLPIQYKRRKSIKEKKTPTTDSAAIRKLSRTVSNPIFNLILSYKKANTLLRFLDVKLSSENKVHTSYNVCGAASDDEEDTKKQKRSFGRWSSSKSIILPYGSGNLQNIPPEARKMYLAKPGWKILEADYKQAEAEIVAHLTGNHKIQQMFKASFGLPKSECKPFDIHILKATELYGVSCDEVTKEQRNVGKCIRHARNYAAGPLVLANKLQISMTDAKKLIALDIKMDPSLDLWHMCIQEELKHTRVLTNLLGRKHRFLDRWGDTLFRSAYSFIPQSTVGDLLNVGLRKVYDTLPSVPFEVIILLQLHDAIYTMVENKNVPATIKLLRDNMLIPLNYNNQEFTIDVDFKLKTSWAEGEELEIDWREVKDEIPNIKKPY
jgi:DNA polymerase-1